MGHTDLGLAHHSLKMYNKNCINSVLTEMDKMGQQKVWVSILIFLNEATFWD